MCDGGALLAVVLVLLLERFVFEPVNTMPKIFRSQHNSLRNISRMSMCLVAKPVDRTKVPGINVLTCRV
jgi:hypothetical protein